jgi:glycosyltransferase involved in cell wall biosynthesis
LADRSTSPRREHADGRNCHCRGGQPTKSLEQGPQRELAHDLFSRSHQHDYDHDWNRGDPVDDRDLLPLYRAFPDMPLVSVSNAQRQPIAEANFAKTIYHGLPLDLLAPTYEAHGGYLAFLGRISPEKRPDRAIAIAKALGLPLRIAAKVDKVDEAYFREVITPLLDRPGVEFVGEISDCNKAKFLGDALALLFPIDWPEPFGLVMIEAMACGTPVLGFRRGSVREIIDDRVTGRIVDTVDEAIRAAPEVIRLDRRAVRRRRMANDYVEVYRRLGRGTKLVPDHAASALGPNIIPLHRNSRAEHRAT